MTRAELNSDGMRAECRLSQSLSSFEMFPWISPMQITVRGLKEAITVLVSYNNAAIMIDADLKEYNTNGTNIYTI